jgi:very-short-patch-repair endonuclease
MQVGSCNDEKEETNQKKYKNNLNPIDSFLWNMISSLEFHAGTILKFRFQQQLVAMNE